MNCPNCKATGSEIVHTEFHSDYALAVHGCKECGADWDLAYSQPEIMEVRKP